MIKRTHVRQFLGVVDAGTFTAAAERLGLTQPTLSLGIAELERLTGARLFVREKRRVRLTEAGARFLAQARRAEREFRALDQFDADLPAEQSPLLRLGTIRSVASAVLQGLVARLVETARIELVEGTDAELRAALDAGRIDMALTVLRPDETDAPALPPDPHRLMVSEAHRLAGRTRVSAEELAGETMIARRSCEILRETSAFFTARGVRPPFALRSDNDARCMALVAASAGVTTAPLSLAVPGVRALAIEGYDFIRRVGLIGDAGAVARHGASLAGLQDDANAVSLVA